VENLGIFSSLAALHTVLVLVVPRVAVIAPPGVTMRCVDIIIIIPRRPRRPRRRALTSAIGSSVRSAIRRLTAAARDTFKHGPRPSGAGLVLNA
jgi:hypothetical protein